MFLLVNFIGKINVKILILDFNHFVVKFMDN